MVDLTVLHILHMVVQAYTNAYIVKINTHLHETSKRPAHCKIQLQMATAMGNTTRQACGYASFYRGAPVQSQFLKRLNVRTA